jgi:uncharacterized protein YhaN
LETVEGLKEDIDKTRSKVQKLGNDISSLKTRIDEREKRIEELNGNISDAEEGIQKLIEQTGISNLGEFKRILDERKDLEDDNKDLITRLEERHDKSGLPLKEQMEHWENEITKLEKFSSAAQGVNYKPQKEAELTDEIENLEEEIAEIEDELREYRKQFEDIAKDANRILAPEESFPGETLEDMKFLQGKLEGFINKIERRKDNAIMAIRLFEQIEAEEEEKVKDLFGQGDLASKYFREITNGRYDSVEYDPEIGTLIVNQPEGERLEAWQLSTGTFDQLYFATRLSLAHQILGGEEGFLLLDDPFLAADSARLANQLDMLVDQVEDGWQIIYFSVKDEVVDYLQAEHKDEFVDYIELKPIV